ncbi:MAG TPA: ribonuclease HII [Patescibacteria group bacterium]|nr:ribonuclease HII [Patescibacteria group bacterium]
MPSRPGWAHERRIERDGFRHVAGLDEVGRGSLAGPVVVAAVILRPGARLEGVNDSKLLSPGRREVMARLILRSAAAWGLGAADAGEIDELNILNATRLAMTRAVAALPGRPDHLLIDAVTLPGVGIAQTSLIKGDRISVTIAAASVVAKVMRDRLMGYYDRKYPGFGFAANKGYGTRQHLEAVTRQGACPIHRLTFRGVGQGSSIGLGERLGH